MKKYLPFILLFAGLLAVVGGIIFVKGKKKAPIEEEETALIEVSLPDRPIASLTPTEDGHYLDLKIEKIVIDAESMDYELLYKTGTGITQGVPGTVELDGRDFFEAELLLGSESSGKFRYDEGVEEGTLTLRFRNNKGKLLVKFATDFHLQSDSSELTSLDGGFAYELDIVRKGYFVTMETFGFPGDAPGDVVAGPYGVFGSSEDSLDGQVVMDNGTPYAWYGSAWKKLDDSSSSDIGVFVGVGQ
jgi:hypothetical protein